MATLRDIKRRIGSVANTEKITSAMKMVSAAKLKRSQRFLEEAEPYNNILKTMMENVISSVEGYSNPLIEKRETIKKIGIIVIAGDKGLCGAFNNHVFKEAETLIRNINDDYPDADFALIPLGNKAVKYFNRHYGDKVDYSFNDIYASLEFSAVVDIIKYAADSYVSGKYDKVIFIYNSFINIAKQKIQRVSFLPLTVEVKENDTEKIIANYIYEPDKEGILDTLIPLYVNAAFRQIFLSSNTAVHAARMLAMDNATNNANDLIKELNLQYNKARQSSITTEMLEIVSGAEALAG